MDIVRLSTVYIHIIKWNDYSALIEKIISQSCSRQTVRYLYSVTLGRTLTVLIGEHHPIQFSDLRAPFSKPSQVLIQIC